MSKRNFISNYLHLNKGRGWDRGLRFVALCKTKSNVFESETMSKLSDDFQVGKKTWWDKDRLTDPRLCWQHI